MPEASEPNSSLEFDLDPTHAGDFLRAVGLHYDALTALEVRAHLEVSAQHHTPWGITHGGLYATVIESVASVGASHAVQAEGRFAVGVNNQTDFLRPYTAGRLEVRGTPIQQGRNLQLWLVEISDGQGRLIARGQVRLFNQTLPDR
jgi:1,4-dihydroxy-2-naphthoyl-CoA hydrolase